MRLRVAILSLLATWLFFHEYLPPWKKVHLFADIEGYHYPLFGYAQRAFHEGRLPQWDAAIYSGISYVGNAQAALFYPPNWLVYAANWNRTGTRFLSIEMVEILHYWIAFLLAWLWLRGRSATQIAPLLGAAVFAFAGYRMAESQHYGATCGYSWYPLGLWGIDEAARQKHWRPLWKVAAASALCLLAGYPSTWFVFCVCCAVYALCNGGWRMALQSTAAIAFSLLLAMVQLAPALEASFLKFKEQVYGGGLFGGPLFYLQFFLPNFYDHSFGSALGPPEESYLYLGAPALLGFAWVMAHRLWRPVLPAIAILGVSFLFIVDPVNLIVRTVVALPLIPEICREWNFLAALAIAGAMIAAAGVDDLASQPAHHYYPWLAVPAAALWSVRQWMVWKHGGHFATGWWTLTEAAITVAILYALLRSPRRAFVTSTILLVAGMELKVYGTSRHFDAVAGSLDAALSGDLRTGGPNFVGVDPAIYEQLRRNVDYRIVSDGGPYATELRYYGLSSPQGFDPFLPAQYRALVEQYTPFVTNREFRFDWANPAMMDAFGARYVFTSANAPARAKLLADPRFRVMQPDTSYYSVFEYLAALPAYRFDAGTAARISWTPERRQFRVRSDEGGEFHLLEQYFPGWRAYVDSNQVPIDRVRTAFQGIRVPPGTHIVEFRYSSTGFEIGAIVSLISLCGTGLLVGRHGRKAFSTASSAE